MSEPTRRENLHSRLKACKLACQEGATYVFFFHGESATEEFSAFVKQAYAGNNRSYPIKMEDFNAGIPLPDSVAPTVKHMSDREREQISAYVEKLETSGITEEYRFQKLTVPWGYFASRNERDAFRDDVDALIQSRLSSADKPEWLQEPTDMATIMKLRRFANRATHLTK